MTYIRGRRWRLVRNALALGAIAALAFGGPATAQATSGAPARASDTARHAAASRPFYGGEAIHSASGLLCTAGFIVSGGSTRYVLVSAACTSSASSWYTADGVLIGTTAASGPNGAGLIQITNPDLDPQGAVLVGDGPVDVTGSQLVTVGAKVCKSTSISGTTCGTVLAYNETVAFPEGTVTGVTRTDLCSEPGESGAPVVAGDQAQGVVIGFSTGGCITYLAPAGAALALYGLTLD